PNQTACGADQDLRSSESFPSDHPTSCCTQSVADCPSDETSIAYPPVGRCSTAGFHLHGLSGLSSCSGCLYPTHGSDTCPNPNTLHFLPAPAGFRITRTRVRRFHNLRRGSRPK